MKIKNRERFLTFATIGVIAFYALDRVVETQLVPAWKERNRRISETTAYLNRAVFLLDRERTIRDRWGNMKSHALPANKSVAENEVLKSAERWAQESRISFTSIKPRWTSPAEDHLTLECRVDASGSIEAVTRFLYELEKDPLALKVEDLEITARDSEGQLLALGVRFSGLLLNVEEK